VLDSQQRIVDFNTSASSILSINAEALGKKVQNHRHAGFGEKIACFLKDTDPQQRVDLLEIDSQSFDIHIKVLHGIPGFEDGYIIKLNLHTGGNFRDY
jgi:hypothetical protein